MKRNRFGTMISLVAVASLSLTACGSDDPKDGASSAMTNATSAVENTPAETTEPAVTTEPSETTEPAATTEPGDDASTPADPAAPAEQYTSPYEGLTGSLKGEGASSQESAMTAWQAGYTAIQPGVQVQYAAEGSGAGRSSLIAGAVSFAGSDAALDEEEREAVKKFCGTEGAMNLPVYISPIAVPYNLEGVEDLQLKPDTLAKIFDGKITKWNDKAIAADNPDATLPDLAITPVHRSDESGTTENFMDYLTEAAPDAWKYEADKVWPVQGGEAGAKTAGVIQAVKATNGTIGYADASQVGDLKSAKIGVGDSFVAFSPEAAAAVVDNSKPAESGIEGDLALELKRDIPESYPIVLVSYHVVCKSYKDETTANMVKDFVGYVASAEGQATAAEAAGSAPISPALQSKVKASLDSIKVAG